MYREFFIELALSAPLLAHSIYQWSQWRKQEDREPWSRPATVFIAVLAALFAVSAAAGIVIAAVRGEPSAAMGMGAVAILMGIWLDFKVGRACGK